jgi:hypothetical protein
MSLAVDGLPVWIALLPLGGYLIVVGWLHLCRRPIAVPGGWDLAALAMGLSGLLVAGPLSLLQPAVGMTGWGSLLLAGGLVLIVTAGILATRPRLVVYNVTPEQLRPVLSEVVARLDASARWAGDSVVLPARGLQVLMDGRGLGRCVSVATVGGRSSPESWAEFTRQLRRASRRLRVRRNPWGAVVAGLGVGLVALACGWGMVSLWRPAAGRLAAPPVALTSDIRNAPPA